MLTDLLVFITIIIIISPCLDSISTSYLCHGRHPHEYPCGIMHYIIDVNSLNIDYLYNII